MKPYAKNTGPLIRAARIAKGYSQGELDHLMGLKGKGRFTSNLEQGRINLPRERARQICDVLGIDMTDMRNNMVKDLIACLDYDLNKDMHEFKPDTNQSSFALDTNGAAP